MGVWQGARRGAHIHEVLDAREGHPALDHIQDLLRQHHQREAQQVEQGQRRESDGCSELVAQGPVHREGRQGYEHGPLHTTVVVGSALLKLSGRHHIPGCIE